MNKKIIFIGLITVVLCHLSSVSFAQNIINSNIKMIESELLLPITTKHIDPEFYYLQFLYTGKNKKFALDRIKSIQKYIKYPMAIQPYNTGYRLYVGIIKGSDVTQIQKSLYNIGYNDSFLRKINPSSIREDIFFKKIGIIEQIEEKTIIVPYNKNGSIALFSSLEANLICQSIDGHANIALLSEYGGVLSKSDELLPIGIQYRFWLTSKKTVTRVSNDLVIKNIDNKEVRYPIICINRSIDYYLP
ncbi:hypothetical protein [Photobacterium carnosum]|uniref:hypothetical protein n=1 Tax=Photobacterium carnosum TaxID=2023717 RepID=UPI001E2A5EED|nr:hypothetical protein [Photobacterium carnosum]MCD9526247.1 hypothetical protein [Photobacterium carnosum]